MQLFQKKRPSLPSEDLKFLVIYLIHLQMSNQSHTKFTCLEHYLDINQIILIEAVCGGYHDRVII